MTIKDALAVELKDALRNQDRARLDVIRQITSEASKAAAEPGFVGDGAGDEHFQSVISSYVKKMVKAQKEYEGYGERGAQMVAKLRFETDYLAQYLPAATDVGDTAEVVAGAIAELGATDPKQSGQVIGLIMKNHQGLDGALVSQLVREMLAGE